MSLNQATRPIQLGFGAALARPILDRITVEDRKLLEGKILKDAIDHCFYDTRYLVAGTVVPTGQFKFFQIQDGQNDTLINNSAVSFAKSRQETNMNQAGQLQRGRFFILESIECKVTIPANLDLTLQSAGNTTLPLATGTFAAADATHSGIVTANVENAVINSLFLQSFCGEKTYEEGTADLFPSQFGISGYSGNLELGTVTSGSNISVNDGVANNGFGRARVLRMPRVIVNGVNFGINAQFFNAFNPGRNLAIKVIYSGILFRNVQ